MKKTRKPIKKKTRKPLKPSPSVSASSIVRVNPPPEQSWMIQPEEVTILKNSIAKGASDEELKFCLTVARRYKLDPFKQQIWFVKRWDSSAENGAGGTGAYVWTPQVGINGLLFAAARDHREEFGSISKPQYGEEVKGAPVWASVKITKKNGSVTEAEARWSEYAPADLGKAPFWRKMPYRMLGKCATALAVREAYPDLGGLYIPEEMEKINEEYTKEGRRIIEKAGLDVPAMGTHAAGQAVAAAKIAQLRQAKETEEAAVEVPKANKPDPLPPAPSNGTVEVEWLEKDAIVRGDIANLLPLMQEKCMMEWVNDWWHCTHHDVKTIGEMCAQLGYRMTELLPKSSPAVATPTATAKPGQTAAKGNRGETGRSAPVAAEVVKGTIQHFTEKMTKGREADPDKGIKAKASQPFLSVLLKTDSGDRWYSLFDRDLIPFISKGKGKEGEFFVQNNGKFWNMVGIKRIGGQEFEENVPVIQQKTREAGQKTLY